MEIGDLKLTRKAQLYLDFKNGKMQDYLVSKIRKDDNKFHVQKVHNSGEYGLCPFSLSFQIGEDQF